MIHIIIQGDVCGSGVRYPLIGAIREELLGIPRETIAPGIEPADIDWETVSTALAPVQATTLPPATRIDINSVFINDLYEQLNPYYELNTYAST